MVIVFRVLIGLVVLFIRHVGDDVCKVVQQFFKSGWILAGMNSNVISLTPKISCAENIQDFRFKIISKILADRLAHIASRMLSPNQNDFIK